MTTPRSPVRRRQGGAFLLPLLAIGWVGQGGAEENTAGAHLFLVAVVGAATGAAWQLLHRRDLVDRLTYFASAFAVCTVFFFAAAWDSSISSSLTAGVLLGGLLTGLVYAEQWLRGRDDRRVRRAARWGSRQQPAPPAPSSGDTQRAD